MSKVIVIEPDELRAMLREFIQDAIKPKADELLTTGRASEVIGITPRGFLLKAKREGIENHGTQTRPMWRRGDVEALIAARRAG